MRRIVPLVLLGACEPEQPPVFECPDRQETPEWSAIGDGLGSGVLLSAWSDDAIVRMVGGDLGGGAGVFVTYDGDEVCVEEAVTERALWWLHGSEPGEFWAVGEAGTILHSVDGVRTREDVATAATLFGVFDTGDVVWAVGGDVQAGTGEIWRRDATGWASVLTDAPGVLFKVWQDTIVGDRVGYRLQEGAWQPVDNDTRLLTTRGDGTDTYAVGGTLGPEVRQWDNGWQELPTTGLNQPLNGVWTAPGADLWVAGNFGTAARWDGATWQAPNPPPSVEHFHAVWGHCDEVLFVGGNLFSAGSNYGTVLRYGPPQGSVRVVGSPCP